MIISGIKVLQRGFIFIRTKLTGIRNQPERFFAGFVELAIYKVVGDGIITEYISVGKRGWGVRRSGVSCCHTSRIVYRLSGVLLEIYKTETAY
jgi:hypothetical protein